MRVLDLFSGVGGFSHAFADAGHTIVTVDLDPRFNPTHVLDVLQISDLSSLGDFDVILASPPCECFSVASIGTHWTGRKGHTPQPKTLRARNALALMQHTFSLIERAQPMFWCVENPRGIMRKVAPLPPTGTVWFCQYGDSRAKPTDLWTNIDLEIRACHNGAADHEPAPRGSRTGTQGIRTAAERARIPYGLSAELEQACSSQRTRATQPPAQTVLPV